MPALTSFTKKSDIDLGSFIQIDPVCYNNLSKGLCDDFYKTLTEDEKKDKQFYSMSSRLCSFCLEISVRNSNISLLEMQGCVCKEITKYTIFLQSCIK